MLTPITSYRTKRVFFFKSNIKIILKNNQKYTFASLLNNPLLLDTVPFLDFSLEGLQFALVFDDIWIVDFSTLYSAATLAKVHPLATKSFILSFSSIAKTTNPLSLLGSPAS